MFRFLVTTMLLHQLVTGDSSSPLQTVFDQFFQWRLKDSPETATYLNIHSYDDQLSQYGLGQMDFTKAKVDSFLKSLGLIDYRSLSKKEQVSYAVLNSTLTTVSNGYQWRLYGGLSPVNFLEGIQLSLRLIVVISPFKSKQNFENYLARLRGGPQEIQDQITLMKEAIRLKRTNNAVSMMKVPSQLNAVITDDPANFILYSPFKTRIDKINISQSDKADLQTRGLNASVHYVDALKQLKTFILQEYMNHTRGTYGVDGMDQAGTYYSQCLKWYLTVDISPQQVHQTGLNEVARISNEMKQVMQRQNFSGSISDYFTVLRKDPKFHFKTGSEIIARYKDIITNRIYPKLSSLFKNIPPANFRVTEMDSDGGVAVYRHGSSDGKRPGVFQANVHRPNETDSFDMMAVALHEAVPGHHLQRSLQMASDLPDFRKEDIKGRRYSVPFTYPRYTAYIEGWGLYAEYLGVEMGLYKDDYELMGRYSNEIWRACRLVVDTGIHHMGWNRSQAVDYFRQYTSLSGEILQNEIDRYITWPGQSCAYKVGEIKIRDLRQEAEKTLAKFHRLVHYTDVCISAEVIHDYKFSPLITSSRISLSELTKGGSKFDIKEFHDVVLTAGPVPLSLLESVVNDWISDTLGSK